jgi:hypothetical protein
MQDPPTDSERVADDGLALSSAERVRDVRSPSAIATM